MFKADYGQLFMKSIFRCHQHHCYVQAARINIEGHTCAANIPVMDILSFNLTPGSPRSMLPDEFR
jgi:hypothetical protein